ncbi:YybS family protein [Jeotgalibacillus proteolyticus]|uniref:YybS family protein n=1 Tax=Jeotgalibacillus proteolyticus TaxID=2082395 RepID=UPI003CF082C7
MNDSHARRIKEGAVLTAIFAVLLSVTVYVPPLGSIIQLVLVFPYIIYSSKYSFKSSLLMIAAGIGASAIVGTAAAIPFAFAFSTAGVLMGWMIKENKSKLLIFISSTLIFIFHVLLFYVGSILLLGINLIDDLFNALNEFFQEFISQSEAAGVDVADLSEQWTGYIGTLELLMPTWIVATVAVWTWLILLINFPLAKRFSVKVPRFNPFHELSFPKSVIWYYLIVLILALVSAPDEGTTFAFALLNLQAGLELIMLVQGLSFIHFWGHLKGWGKGRLILFTIIGMMLNPFTRILGIIDLGFDLRERLRSNGK